MLLLKQQEFEKTAVDYFTQFFETFAKSDKKTMKDNITPFFTHNPEIAHQVIEPFPLFTDKAPDKWNEAFKTLIEGSHYKVKALATRSESTILDPSRIL